MKSGTPAAINGEGTKGENAPESSPGNVQATLGGARRESWFSMPARTGVAGAGGESGVEGETQQQDSAQLLQSQVVRSPPLAGAWATIIACIQTSSKLNKMADNRFTLFL